MFCHFSFLHTTRTTTFNPTKAQRSSSSQLICRHHWNKTLHKAPVIILGCRSTSVLLFCFLFLHPHTKEKKAAATARPSEQRLQRRQVERTSQASCSLFIQTMYCSWRQTQPHRTKEWLLPWLVFYLTEHIPTYIWAHKKTKKRIIPYDIVVSSRYISSGLRIYKKHDDKNIAFIRHREIKTETTMIFQGLEMNQKHTSLGLGRLHKQQQRFN